MSPAPRKRAGRERRRSGRGRAIVAVIGTGVIGRSWIQVFARAGAQVRVHDPDPAQLKRAMVWLGGRWRSRVSSASDLAQALTGAIYVQESGPERLEVKQSIYADLVECGRLDEHRPQHRQQRDQGASGYPVGTLQIGP